MKAICLFAGAAVGNDPAYVATAMETGKLLADRAITMVFGGGHRGLMGAAADAALSTGGRVVGIIPAALQRREQSYAPMALTELHVVTSMHARKAMMARLSDAFLALPGGFGTIEELCEMTTWTQLGIHAKPVVLVNVRGYFDPLLTMFDRAVTDGFLDAGHRGIVRSAPTPVAALALIERFAPPSVAPWTDLEEV